MTLVVTSVSLRGITVVTDKAASWPHGDQTAANSAESKSFVSHDARIAVAIWGSTRWPGGGYSKWVRAFVAGLEPGADLHDAATRFANEVNETLHPANWSDDRRGAHFVGYVHDLPHLYHVHTGPAEGPQGPLSVHREYPELLKGDERAYRRALKRGEIFLLRNGRYDLHAIVGGRSLNRLHQDFLKGSSRNFGVTA